MADTTPVVSAVKPGIQTTEFALTVFVNVVTVGMTFSNMIPAPLLGIILAIVNSIYIIMRSIVKNGDPAYNAPALPVSAVATVAP